MDTGVEAVKRAIEQKRHELNALEQALSVLEGGVYTAEKMASLPKSREFEHLGITAATVKLMEETGEHMDTRQIADLLLDRGLRTRSKNFIATVYATLDNAKKQFRRTKTGKWELIAEGEKAR